MREHRVERIDAMDLNKTLSIVGFFSIVGLLVLNANGAGQVITAAGGFLNGYAKTIQGR
jgi:hypothetical protein